MGARIGLLMAVLVIACSLPTSPPLTTPRASEAITPSSSGAPVASSGAPASSSGASASWRRIADIPTPRSEVAATVFRGEVYVIGGFGGGRVVEIFDGQRWRRGPDLPVEVDHAMAAAVDDNAGGGAGVYLVGGNTSIGGLLGSSTARAFRLEAGAGTWREIAAMPGPRSQAAAVTRGSSIYIVGGYDGQRLVAPTYAYEAPVDRWHPLAAIPTPRDHLAAAMIVGRICAVGGRKLSLTANLATFECYEPGADRWETMPDAPTARGGVGAAAVGDRLVFVGGEQPIGTYKEIEIFDPATGKWSRGPDLPTPRHGLGVVAVRGTVYVMSGGPTPGGSQTPVCEALDLR